MNKKNNKNKNKNKQGYPEIYIRPDDCQGKTVNICLRPEYHALIKQILLLAGDKKQTVRGYLHRVIDEHFKMYKDSINDLYVQKQDTTTVKK